MSARGQSLEEEGRPGSKIPAEKSNPTGAGFNSRKLAFECGKIVIDAGADDIESDVGDFPETQRLHDRISDPRIDRLRALP